MIKVWTSWPKNLGHWDGDWNHVAIVLMFFPIGNRIQVIGLGSGCGQVYWKILDVEMVTKILNCPNYFLVFFSALPTEVRYSDYDWNVDKLTKKSWSLKWWLDFGDHFVMVHHFFSFFLNFFICTGDQVLIVKLQSKSW
jgi:hypothetical protein